ncbi:MAG TPA: hypothetical protein PKD69_07665, partial [Elusimicrobiota bacterium]|nr:hypothetical protein [Elusimicrobiota bacterium]
VSASGTTETKTNTRNADGTVTRTPSQATNVYAIVFGQAQIARTTVNSSTSAGASDTGASNVTEYFYNEKGQLVSARGSGSSSTTTYSADYSGAINRVNADKTREHMTERVSPDGTVTLNYEKFDETGKRIVWGTIVERTDSAGKVTVQTNGKYIDGKNADGSDKVVDVNVNSNPIQSTTDALKKGITLTNASTSTSHSNTTYKIIAGQAVAIQTTTSTTSTNLGTVSHNVTTVINTYNQRAQLIAATGRVTGSSTTAYWNDLNGDGVWQEDTETEEQNAVSEGSIVYLILNGQAAQSDSHMVTQTEIGATKSVTTADTHYSYNQLGQLTGGYGTSHTESVTTYLDESEQKGVFVEKTGRSTSDTSSTYISIWGQAVVSQAVTTTVTESGATRSTSTITVNYSYNASGQLIAAEGHGTSHSETSVWNDTNNDGVHDVGELELQVTDAVITNTYDIIGGQAFV